MKICQLCAVDFTLYHFIAPLMRALAAEGHEVVGVCSDGPFLDKMRAEGLRVAPVAIDRSFNVVRHLGTYRELVRLFRRERFDMVHVHTPVAALIGRLAAKRARVPRIVYTAHGFYFHDGMPAWKRAPFVALERWAGRHTDVLFTQAAEDAETARRLGLCGTGAIEAIGNGVDPARFAPRDDDADTRQAVRASIGTAHDKAVIMMIGRLVAEKGYPELFEAMGSLGAELWAIGDRLPSDHAGAVVPPADDKIKLLGYRADVPSLLKAADIFVLPSHREGMPRAIIEAMMAGLPVVATDIRGAREEVVPEETGLLVPPRAPEALAGALRRLIDDPDERTRFGDAGRARALAEFDEAIVIDRQLRRLGLRGATA